MLCIHNLVVCFTYKWIPNHWMCLHRLCLKKKNQYFWLLFFFSPPQINACILPKTSGMWYALWYTEDKNKSMHFSVTLVLVFSAALNRGGKCQHEINNWFCFCCSYTVHILHFVGYIPEQQRTNILWALCGDSLPCSRRNYLRSCHLFE